MLSDASFEVNDHQEDIKEYRQGENKNDAAGRLPKRRCPSCKKRLQAAQSLEKQIAHKQSLR
jgi:hypothetical protein